MNEFIITGVIELIMPLDHTSSGIKVMNFTVRHDRPCDTIRKKDDLFRITAFKDVAETATRYKPGEKVLIKGRMQDNNYSRDDKTYYTAELIAEQIHRIV